MWTGKKEAGKKARFYLEVNEMPDKSGRFATGFVRHFLNFDIWNSIVVIFVIT